MAFGDIDVPFFHEAGLVRKKCRVTDLWFWTRDKNRETCGDTVEDEYTFIGNPLIAGFEERGRELKDKMRETFLSFFEEKAHTRVEPYPVIARWRDDIHLTIASIADFQPDVTSGIIPPPANPLTISQPCIRLTDVAAVGRSGRHLTTFEMMAHHCFNRPEEGDIVYWIDECVRFCDELFTERLGIEANEITYVENPWAGGGNAGPAVEVIVGGLELATLVFMNLQEDPEGDIVVKGDTYSEMPLQIIDTGYGLERFCWAAAGTPTIYESIYPETVSMLMESSGINSTIASLEGVDTDLMLSELSRLAGILNIDVGTDVSSLYDKLQERLADRGVSISLNDLKSVVEPLAAVYAIPDHLHALCNMLGDCLVPSNVKAGYLARMLARRTLRLRDSIGIKLSLADLGRHHLKVNIDSSGFRQTDEGIIRILELEEQRYSEMIRAGEAAVRTAFRDIPKDAEEIPDEILFNLAESRGIQPEMAVEIAGGMGWTELSVRLGLAADMAARHAAQAKQAASSKQDACSLSYGLDLPVTEQIYYEDTSRMSITANVLHCQELTREQIDSLDLSVEVEGLPSHLIILNRTLFYPEGGGQLGDQGTLRNGSTAKVLDTRTENGLILHLTDSPLTGEVEVCLNEARRTQLMDHHTAVHIVGGSAREVLGPHVWQAGSNKGERYARLDITHFERLDRSTLDCIEDAANKIITDSLPVEKLVLDRADADAQFGFELYQGGPPKHTEIRVIKIGEHDIQACGGTHHDSTSAVGEVRIVRSSAVQDGVERLQIVAGETAREHAREQERLLTEASEVLGVQPSDLPTTVSRFFEEWKEQRKKIQQLEAEMVRLRTGGGGSDSVTKDGIRYVVMETEGDNKQLLAMASEITRDPSTPTVAVLGSKDGGGKLLVAITEGSAASEKYDATVILNQIAPLISGGGGGRPTIAQGGGQNPDGVPDALNKAKEIMDISNQ